MSGILLFYITRYLILSNILSYFSSNWNNVRYLVLSYFRINLSTLSKITHSEFVGYEVLCATSYIFITIVSYDFASNKILSKSRPLT